jgi:hypothetical protein
MLFIFLDQCLGRCECASPQDRTALLKFLAQREKASRGDLSARMEAFWNPVTDDEDELLDGPPKRPYWRKDSKLGYDCPTRNVRFTFTEGKLVRVYQSNPPLLDEIVGWKTATKTTG